MYSYYLLCSPWTTAWHYLLTKNVEMVYRIRSGLPRLCGVAESFPSMLCLVTQLCPTLCNPMACSLPGFSVHRDSPGRNTRVARHALLQGVFSIQGLKPVFPHYRRILCHLSHQGSPWSMVTLLLSPSLHPSLHQTLRIWEFFINVYPFDLFSLMITFLCITISLIPTILCNFSTLTTLVNNKTTLVTTIVLKLPHNCTHLTR